MSLVSNGAKKIFRWEVSFSTSGGLFTPTRSLNVLRMCLLLGGNEGSSLVYYTISTHN